MNLGQEYQPQIIQLLFRPVAGTKFRQFDKHQLQALNPLFRMLYVHNLVVVVVHRRVGVENFVDKTQRIHRLQQLIDLIAFQLPHIGLRRVKQHAAFETFGPVHLHFYDKFPSRAVGAAYVNDGVLQCGNIRRQFRLLILQIYDLLRRLQRQHTVEQTLTQVLVLTEDALENEVVFWVKVAFHNRVGIKLFKL